MTSRWASNQEAWRHLRATWPPAAYDLPGPWPRGAVLGVVDLVDVRPLEEADGARSLAPFRPGWFAWITANPRPLPEPIPLPGLQGLWRLPAHARDALEALA